MVDRYLNAPLTGNQADTLAISVRVIDGSGFHGLGAYMKSDTDSRCSLSR